MIVEVLVKNFIFFSLLTIFLWFIITLVTDKWQLTIYVLEFFLCGRLLIGKYLSNVGIDSGMIYHIKCWNYCILLRISEWTIVDKVVTPYVFLSEHLLRYLCAEEGLD